MHCHAVLVFQHYSFKEISPLQFHLICLRQSIRPSQHSNPNSHTVAEGGMLAMFSTLQATDENFPTEFWVKINAELWMIVYKWPSECVSKKAVMSSCIFWVISYRSVKYTDIFIFFPIVVNLFIWSGEKLSLSPSNNTLLFSFTRISHRLVLLFKIK